MLREKYPRVYNTLIVLKIIAYAIAIYFITSYLAIGLTHLLIALGVSTANATQSGMLLSFLIYAFVIIVVFSKKQFKKSMQTLHTWSGLIVGWFLYFIFVTGTVGYFDVEVDRWMEPKFAFKASKYEDEYLIDSALDILEQEANSSKKWVIYLPSDREDSLKIKYAQPSEKPFSTLSAGHGDVFSKRIIDPDTLDVYLPREQGGGQILYKMHYTLYYIPRMIGFILVGIFSMIMLVALINGILIHLNIFKDYFTFRREKNIRTWMDAHILTAVIALPFFLMITYSGLLFFVNFFMPMIPKAHYEGAVREMAKKADPKASPVRYQNIYAPLYSIAEINKKAEAYFDQRTNQITIVHPNDASAVVIVDRKDTTITLTSQEDRLYFSGTTGEMLESPKPQTPEVTKVKKVFLGLHRALFADEFLRWLFFISGVVGSVMIATGLILWSKKREFKQRETFGYKLVEALNKGTVVGLPIAIGFYFIANRLFFERSIEVNTLFISWLALVIASYIFKLSWRILLLIAGLVYLAIPILSNIVLEEVFLFIGFDIFFLACALIMLVGYYFIQKREKCVSK